MSEKKDRITGILNDPYIRDFITKYGLSPSVVSDHFNIFNDSYVSLNRCRGCKGLFYCTQEKKGEMMTLAYDGNVYTEISYCPYYLKKLKKDRQVNAFVRNDIPDNYAEVCMDDVELYDENTENLCALCYDILDGKREKGLYISGDLGVGKTYMCIALANSLVKKGEKTAFIKSNYFINEMRKLVAVNSDEYEKTIDRIKKVKYLFIDDIGSESVSSYSRDDLLFNILDYRMENRLCTVFTSNLSKESLLKHYTYDKNDNSSIIRARRLLERIDILSDNFVLKGQNRRRG